MSIPQNPIDILDGGFHLFLGFVIVQVKFDSRAGTVLEKSDLNAFWADIELVDDAVNEVLRDGEIFRADGTGPVENEDDVDCFLGAGLRWFFWCTLAATFSLLLLFRVDGADGEYREHGESGEVLHDRRREKGWCFLEPAEK